MSLLPFFFKPCSPLSVQVTSLLPSPNPVPSGLWSPWCPSPGLVRYIRSRLQRGPHPPTLPIASALASVLGLAASSGTSHSGLSPKREISLNPPGLPSPSHVAVPFRDLSSQDSFSSSPLFPFLTHSLLLFVLCRRTPSILSSFRSNISFCIFRFQPSARLWGYNNSSN